LSLTVVLANTSREPLFSVTFSGNVSNEAGIFKDSHEKTILIQLQYMSSNEMENVMLINVINCTVT